MQKIIVGSDHGGFKLKQTVKKLLKEKELEVSDAGTDSENSCDYPDFAYKAAGRLAAGEFDAGILICKSGIGMSIAANRVPGIRAALCYNHEAAVLARAHNDANVLVLGSRFVDDAEAAKILQAFLITEFEGGRHTKRVEKLK